MPCNYSKNLAGGKASPTASRMKKQRKAKEMAEGGCVTTKKGRKKSKNY